MERIPTQWKKSKNVLGEFSIHWGEKADRGTTIATARTEAAADKILQAVNSHEALVDLIKSIKAIESLWLPTKADPEHFGEAKALYGMKERIDAALKKAGVEG